MPPVPNPITRAASNEYPIVDISQLAAASDLTATNAAMAAKATQTSVDALSAQLATLAAAIAALPSGLALATVLPAIVAVDSLVGVATTAARADHTHAARVQRKIATLDSSGLATWTFGKMFDAEPSVQYMVAQASGQPVVVEISGFVMGTGANSAKYAGVNVKGYRSQSLPTLTSVSVLALLTGVITGVNSLVTALTGFNVFGGATSTLNGVKVHLSAGDQM